MISNDSRHWRTVAFSSDVPPGKPVRVVCGNSDFVLFRDAQGRCRALTDRCAHRRAALSRGRLTQQFLIECPYHGWRYDGAGACAAIPNLRPDEKIPKNYRVQAYETLERDGFIQILLGVGDGDAEPDLLDVPSLDRQWQGERYLAYPEELFIETLVDCPSSILSITGIQILDDHPFGDPVVSGNQVTIEYAAVKVRRTRRPPKHAAADFAYTLQVCASRTTARVAVHANTTAQLCAAALIVAVPTGRRVTRALWRGSAPEIPGAPMTIECRGHVDPMPVRASNDYVSQSWAGTLAAQTGLDVHDSGLNAGE
jgi:nitrite reductase/ring-hydroxylating ferredoxin subunit